MIWDRNKLRRRLLGGVLLLACAGAGATGMPFERTTPLQEGDKHKVLLFFSYLCEFCAQYDAYFYQWANSFPEQLEFEAVPVLADTASIAPARGFYAARMASPERIALFNQEVFHRLQHQGANRSRMETYRDAAEAVGIPPAEFEAAWHHQDNRKAILTARYRYDHYQPDVTPELLVGGLFRVSANHTNGDYRLLLEVGSGLASRLIEGNAEALR